MFRHFWVEAQSFERCGARKSTSLKFVVCGIEDGVKHEILAIFLHQPQKYHHPRTTIREADFGRHLVPGLVKELTLAKVRELCCKYGFDILRLESHHGFHSAHCQLFSSIESLADIPHTYLILSSPYT